MRSRVIAHMQTFMKACTFTCTHMHHLPAPAPALTHGHAYAHARMQMQMHACTHAGTLASYPDALRHRRCRAPQVPTHTDTRTHACPACTHSMHTQHARTLIGCGASYRVCTCQRLEPTSRSPSPAAALRPLHLGHCTWAVVLGP